MSATVEVGQKRAIEEVEVEKIEEPLPKRQKVELKADQEWKKEEDKEYSEDNEEFVPPENEEAKDDDYYEEDIANESAEVDNNLFDDVNLSGIMPEGFEFDESSVKALRQLAKDYLIDVFENAKLIAKKIGKRDVLLEEDMQVAVEIMRKAASKAQEPESAMVCETKEPQLVAAV